MNSEAKGRGRTVTRTVVASGRARTAVRGSADPSAEHRRKLEALFSGGPGGDVSAQGSEATAGPPRFNNEERVFAAPRKSLGRSPSEYRLRLERLRIAREPEEIRDAADAFLEHHQLPDDLDVLYKVMQHPNERVVREALGQISSLIMQGRLQSALLLEDKLRELDGRVAEAATRSYIDGLRTQLAHMKAKAAAG